MPYISETDLADLEEARKDRAQLMQLYRSLLLTAQIQREELRLLSKPLSLRHKQRRTAR